MELCPFSLLVLMCHKYMITVTVESTSTPLHKYGVAPRALMRHTRKARDRGVLGEYVAGSGTQRVGMQRRSNASVFMKRGTCLFPGNQEKDR